MFNQTQYSEKMPDLLAFRRLHDNRVRKWSAHGAKILSTTSPVPKQAKPQGRTRVGLGKVLLADIDGRSTEARRYREILAQLLADMGGDPSEAQMIIARRAATLAVWCEGRETEMAKGEGVDIGAFCTTANALRRLLADLGLQRKAKDVTPPLRERLLQQQANAA